MIKIVSFLAFITIDLSTLANAESYTSYPARPDRSVDELTLPKLFSHGMILQRDKPLRIWGWTPSGQKVNIQFAGQNKSAQAQHNWKKTQCLNQKFLLFTPK